MSNTAKRSRGDYEPETPEARAILDQRWIDYRASPADRAKFQGAQRALSANLIRAKLARMDPQTAARARRTLAQSEQQA